MAVEQAGVEVEPGEGVVDAHHRYIRVNKEEDKRRQQHKEEQAVRHEFLKQSIFFQHADDVSSHSVRFFLVLSGLFSLYGPGVFSERERMQSQ